MKRTSALLCVGLASCAFACAEQPSLTSTGAAGGHLDAIYVVRGDRVVPVGDAFGGNTSGAGLDEHLVNADGQPLGGAPVAVEFLGLEVRAPEEFPDGGPLDAGPPDAGPPPDASPGPDAAPPDAAPPGQPDGGIRQPIGPLVIAATPAITLEDWLDAGLDVFVTRVGDDAYDVRIDADGLVPNALYSVWLLYLANTTTPALFAVAPLGGLPASFLTDDDGDVDVTWQVTRDAFEAERTIPDAVQVGGSGTPLVLDATTTIVVRLVYHSSGQTNGNGSLAVPTGPRDDVPTGEVGVVGHVGVDVHPHIESVPMSAIARRDP